MIGVELGVPLIPEDELGVPLATEEELVPVSVQTVVETGTTTVTVVGVAVRGQSVIVVGHWEMVILVVE